MGWLNSEMARNLWTLVVFCLWHSLHAALFRKGVLGLLKMHFGEKRREVWAFEGTFV